ncbi:ribosomal protein L7/L12 [Rubrivivax sp. A210]|uniref:ribosomal protein L7/L12 n=1 Tax=Rubrivivax sp. A210 TaxID=2772301 RepID=UPI003986F87C
MALPDHPLPHDVLSELQRANKIEAIKRLRQATGLGLKEAKDAVDAHQRAAAPAAAPGAPGVHGTRLAPGEVPRQRLGSWLWTLALALAALLAFALLGGKA